jgi:hypothetical protein
VRSTADEIAKGSQQLEKDSSRLGFGVGSDGTDGEPRGSVKSVFAQYGIGGQLGRRERCLRRQLWPGWRIRIGFRRLGLRLGLEMEQVDSALPQAR